MKTLYGIQLGNNLKRSSDGKIIEVNGVTKKKIGWCEKGSNIEHYLTLREIEGIPLTIDIIEKYKDFLDNYEKIGDKIYIVPKDSFNSYCIQWFHEFQNILGFYKYAVKWID